MIPAGIFVAAASGLFVQLLAWGLGPLAAFVIVATGASGVTLGTLLVVEALDSRHARARRGQMHVVRSRIARCDSLRPAALEEPGPAATVVDLHRAPAGEIGPGGAA